LFFHCPGLPVFREDYRLDLWRVQSPRRGSLFADDGPPQLDGGGEKQVWIRRTNLRRSNGIQNRRKVFP
jgi:hypothetical protein